MEKFLDSFLEQRKNKEISFPKKEELWKYNNVACIEQDFANYSYSYNFKDDVDSKIRVHNGLVQERENVKYSLRNIKNLSSQEQQSLLEKLQETDFIDFLSQRKNFYVLDFVASCYRNDALEIIHSADDNSFNTAVFFINIQENIQVEVLERSIASKGFFSQYCHIELKENSSFSHYRLCDASLSYFFNTTHCHVAKNANYSTISFHKKAKIARYNLHLHLNEEQANCTFDSLYTVGAKEEVDFHSFVNHNKPYTTSSQLYKGILENLSHAIFNGKVFIDYDAKQSNAAQLNKNIIVSGNARVDSKPELEVYHDDVKASHGATIGNLDEEELFYLLSRGIDEEQAQRMLQRAFMLDIIEKVSNEQIKAILLEEFGAV